MWPEKRELVKPQAATLTTFTDLVDISQAAVGIPIAVAVQRDLDDLDRLN